MEIVDTNGVIVTDSVLWTVNGKVSNQQSVPLILQYGQIANSKIILLAAFQDSVNYVEIGLTISTDIKLSYEEKLERFSFDKNDKNPVVDVFPATGPYNVPWNFMTNRGNEQLKGISSKKKGFYAIDSIIINDSTLIVDPQVLSLASQDFTFSFGDVLNKIVEVNGCDTIPELKIYTETPKNYKIEFFRLCETDGDIQLVQPNLAVSSSNDLCAHGGADFTFDLMYAPGFIQGDDSLYQNQVSNRWEILAGPDKICHTSVNVNADTTCTELVWNTQNALDAINNKLKKVGINFSPIDTSLTNIYFNYDLFVGDLQLQQGEQFSLHSSRLNAGHLNDGATEVYLVDELGVNNNGQTVLGRASNLSENSLSISTKYANTSTLLHEIGHARWGLRHPSQDFPGILNFKENFMFYTGSNRVDKFKRYQFQAIHEN